MTDYNFYTDEELKDTDGNIISAEALEELSCGRGDDERDEQ